MNLPSGKRRKLLIVVTEDWYFVSHRLGLAKAAQRSGFDVGVATRLDSFSDVLLKSGLHIIPLKKLSRESRNPFREMASLVELFNIYRAWRPDIVHHVTFKPVIYGTIAALLVGNIFRVNALAGLGFIFSSKSFKAFFLRQLVRPLLALLLRGSRSRVILQNNDDVSRLMEIGVRESAIRLIRGAGVNLNTYAIDTVRSHPPIVMLASRLIWDKGIGDFVHLARIIKKEQKLVRFVLVGDSDSANPAAIPRSQLEEWHESGDIERWGYRADMPEVYRMATVVCLPSTYGEGIPKTLIEAAACGKPLVSYDVPGCREIVLDGHNGFLAKPADLLAMVEALRVLLSNEELRITMGDKSRKLVETEFSDTLVYDMTISVYREGSSQ
ncbi:MAG: glycosyltransferase family 4 protein [Burkholderiales bacterium]|nr:glycosyltransferase family 4 protein [Burkholderiales bacterium]